MDPNLLSVSLGALGLAAGMGAWILRTRRHAGQAPARETEARAKGDLKALKRALKRCRHLDHVDSRVAETALEQFEQGEDRFTQLQVRLEAKFDRSELTYSRYMSAAELVHQAILGNLRDVEAMMQHLESINAPYARAELKKQATGAQTADISTIESLSERLRLAEQTEAKIRANLAYNERALTELDRVTAAVLEIKTSKGSPSIDLEAAMEELRELAARAKKYSL